MTHSRQAASPYRSLVPARLRDRYKFCAAGVEAGPDPIMNPKLRDFQGLRMRYCGEGGRAFPAKARPIPE
ncbi:hypothetical protein OJF2_32740 [Aquisphaera giovannonii]|uniref:Uncharacterized protein n=1 Tax=Aquisphaera giovannonii TaxID=406548 RepID=A0A5B9W236_9BACT|nr:hypothetical protein OJF2_32740 [Aquisphaera giovannonii]